MANTFLSNNLKFHKTLPLGEGFMLIMKKLLSVVLLTTSILGYTQTSIVNILDLNGERLPNVHYKDINNLLNPYAGTWLYDNGTTSLKIILKKITSNNSLYLEDMIIGEYQYVENGIEKVNTLNEIDIVYPNQISHHISGNSLIKKTTRPVCNDCATNERRLRLGISEIGSFGTVLVRIIDVNGQIGINIRIRRDESIAYVEGTPPPAEPKIPCGEFILIKQ
jgi:hypothetical protein